MRKKMTITFKSKTKLVVPESISRAARLKTGDQLEFKVSGRMITILPKFPVADDTILTPAETKKLRLSLKQVKEGKTIPLSQIKHELGL